MVVFIYRNNSCASVLRALRASRIAFSGLLSDFSIIFFDNSIDENNDKIFYRNDPDNDFEKILNLILPEYLNTYFPKVSKIASLSFYECCHSCLNKILKR